MESTLAAVNDGMANINEKFNRIDSVEDKTEDHRIYAPGADCRRIKE